VPIIINGSQPQRRRLVVLPLGNAETDEQVKVIEYRDLRAGTMREAFVRAFWPGLAFSSAKRCDGSDQNGGNR
jgi:hypothetical protein